MIPVQEKIGKLLDVQFEYRTEREGLYKKRGIKPRRYYELSLLIEDNYRRVLRLHDMIDNATKYSAA